MINGRRPVSFGQNGSIAFLFGIVCLVALVPGLSARVLIAETDNSSVTLEWNAPGDDGGSGSAFQYDIRLSDSPLSISNWDNAGEVLGEPVPQPAGSAESFTIGRIDREYDYYIAIRASDEVPNWSPVSSFVFVPRAPGSMTTDLDSIGMTATLAVDQIDAAGLAYEFAVGAASDFSDAETSTGTVSGSEATLTLTELDPTGTYYWRARAITADSTSASLWTPARAFNLSIGMVNVAPEAPWTAGPQPDEIVTSRVPELTVFNSIDSDEDQLTYEFQILTQDMSSTVASVTGIEEGESMTSWSVPDFTLDNYETYAWRVRSFDGTLYSPWSDTSRFTVGLIGAGTADDGFAARAYPVPVKFSQGQYVTFDLPADPVSLSIITVSGEIVLQKSDLSTTWEWDGKNGSGNKVAAGVYLWYLSDNQGQGKIMVQP